MLASLKFILPPLVGAAMASAATFGLVYSQTQVPNENPASQPVLNYGDR